MTTIAVAGGTGWVGRRVVESVRRLGAEPIVIARSRGVDLTTGRGLDDVLAGVDAVIDVTNIVTQNRRRAIRFFETSTRHLLEAEERHGVGHHLLLSIVGIDRVGMGYYQAKQAQEDVVRQGQVPWTILRATQFHDLVVALFAVQRVTPVVLAPSFAVQPIAVDDVAGRLVELAGSTPAGRVPDIGGPEVRRLPDLARVWQRSVGSRRPVVPLTLPGRVFGGYAAGANLVPGVPYGRITFEEHLAAARR